MFSLKRMLGMTVFFWPWVVGALIGAIAATTLDELRAHRNRRLAAKALRRGETPISVYETYLTHGALR